MIQLPNAEIPSFLQLLLCVFSEGTLARRLHLRFQSGDESYNYLADNVFIGRFASNAAAEAKAFAEHHAGALGPFLVPVSVEMAGLGLHDGGAFLKSLVPGQPIHLPPAAQSPLADAFYIATTSADGDCRARIFPANAMELPAPVVSFLAEFEPLAERLTGAAKLRKKSLTPYTARPGDGGGTKPRKGWWQFW